MNVDINSWGWHGLLCNWQLSGSCLAVLCFVPSPGIFQHGLVWWFFLCLSFTYVRSSAAFERLLTLTSTFPRCGLVVIKTWLHFSGVCSELDACPVLFRLERAEQSSNSSWDFCSSLWTMTCEEMSELLWKPRFEKTACAFPLQVFTNSAYRTVQSCSHLYACPPWRSWGEQLALLGTASVVLLLLKLTAHLWFNQWVRELALCWHINRNVQKCSL